MSLGSIFQVLPAVNRVYRRRGKRYADCCVVERQRLGGGSVMVWGGIMANSRTKLTVLDGNLNAQRYCDDVLTPVALPFIAERRRQQQDVIFQQDNARPHSARMTREHLEQHHVTVLPWPECLLTYHR